MNKQSQIDWLFSRLQEYASAVKLKDMTFLEDIQKDKEYAEKHFDISDSIKLKNV